MNNECWLSAWRVALRYGLALGLGLVVGVATADEAKPRTVLTVAIDDHMPPIIFRDEAGQVQGLQKELWELWSERTGIKVNLVPQEWSKALHAMSEGSADVIDTLGKTDNRERYFEYSNEFIAFDVLLYFRKGVVGVTDIQAARPFIVGVEAGDACMEVLRSNGVENVRQFRNSEAVVKAASDRVIDVFCMIEPAANYYLARANTLGEFMQSPALYSLSQHWGVRKGALELKAQIEAGFALIKPYERKLLKEKWLGAPLTTVGTPAYVRYAGEGLLLVGAVGVALLAWNLALRRKVSAKAQELQVTSRALKLMTGCSMALFHARDRSLLLNDLCRLICKTGGYPYAWIGLADSTGGFGFATNWALPGVLPEAAHSQGVNVLGPAPAEAAVATGRTQVFDLRHAHPLPQAWRTSMQQNGLAACIVLMLGEDPLQGVLVLCTQDGAAFSAEEVALLEELAANIGARLSRFPGTPAVRLS